MKMKGVLAAILTAVLCISGNLLAYSGGDGSKGNPFEIANKVDLLELATDTVNYDKCFIMTANIDLAGESFTQAVIAPDTDTEDEEFDFIGTQFTGIFDGNGHVVSNLTITEPEKDFIGLFGDVGSGGQVKNLGLENVNITGRSLAGGLVGYNEGALTGCHVTGSVSGDTMVGGLIAYNASGSLTSCYATCSVSSNYGVGGLVGTNWGTLTGCYATGSVIGGGCAGGLVGENDRTITSCYATGSVIATSSFAGGLVGLSYSSTLSYCYATGSVTGTGFVGGLVGLNDSGAITSTITSCYATGSVKGSPGGGGLIGVNSGSILSSFWDTDTSGKTTSDGGTGKTTIEMKTLSTFTDAGWDFSTTDGDAADWWMPANSYPQLAWQSVIPGDIAGSYGVNYVDFAELSAHWQQTGCPTGCEDADINDSGTVDMNDLTLFVEHWMEGI